MDWLLESTRQDCCVRRPRRCMQSYPEAQSTTRFQQCKKPYLEEPGGRVRGKPDRSWCNGFRSLMDHPWLLLTNIICTTLPNPLVSSLTKKGRAPMAERDEER